jgi:hypothetical protein
MSRFEIALCFNFKNILKYIVPLALPAYIYRHNVVCCDAGERGGLKGSVPLKGPHQHIFNLPHNEIRYLIRNL